MGHLPYKFEVGDLADRKKKSRVNLSEKILILGHELINHTAVWPLYKILDLGTGDVTVIVAGLIDNNYDKVV